MVARVLGAPMLGLQRWKGQGVGQELLLQRLQNDHGMEGLAAVVRPESHTRPFDAAENSVGLLLSTREGTNVHLWMPLGERVFVRMFVQDPKMAEQKLTMDRRFAQAACST